MHIQVPHKTTKAEAMKRIHTLLEEHRSKITEQVKIVEEKWDADTLNFEIELQGKGITGTLAATDTEYIFDAKLPLLWRIFEGRIQSQIEQQVKQMQ